MIPLYTCAESFKYSTQRNHSVVAVAAVATLFFFYMEKRSYHNYKILSASEQEDVVATNYAEMSGKILRYSPDGASLVS